MSETQDKPLASSPTDGDRRPDGFGPPEITDLRTLDDGRRRGEFETRYPGRAWAQICLELLYLLTVIVTAGLFLLWIARAVIAGPSDYFFPEVFGKLPDNLPMLVWLAAGLSGACGGAASALKWLYHSVAKGMWNRDRVIWRAVVPPLSAMLSVFAGLMVISELLPLFNRALFTSPATGAAFGFFVGLFSDNVLASLQKLAFRIFGTIDRKAD
jgi:hypothetical protein